MPLSVAAKLTLANGNPTLSVGQIKLKVLRGDGIGLFTIVELKSNLCTYHW